VALGGGFARGMAHAGVLEVFERDRIPIHCITGVSAGSIVAATYASGASPAKIARQVRHALRRRGTLEPCARAMPSTSAIRARLFLSRPVSAPALSRPPAGGWRDEHGDPRAAVARTRRDACGADASPGNLFQVVNRCFGSRPRCAAWCGTRSDTARN
jgi:hypothetical protein